LQRGHYDIENTARAVEIFGADVPARNARQGRPR
jgi:hypothetical protein